ncbi:hypothetical protein P4797_15125 [Priestia aryabhattai]|uniref:hypothetical protein n=1 Tax=Priestia aryabhattai TaxID=412384 RepID=UPI001FFF3E1B|nr:hypothetical protein [Priestia aryabhattai]MED3896297.1 hypothetical protein [Priestia aryabhattai]UPK52257.1 hypothetical protein MT476_11820 [Bacillus sp. H8-1]
MEEEKSKLISLIQEFQAIFDEYYKAFMEYLRGGIIDGSEYDLNHPTLFVLANKIQVAYLKLPLELQKRLLDLEFDVFLHCNNQIDFYSFRDFLLEKNRFHQTTTIAQRVDSEVKLAEMLIKTGAWDEYSKLPKRDFNFYKEYPVTPKLMEELKLEFQNRISKRKELSSNENNSNITEINYEKSNEELKDQEDGFFNDAIKKLEKGDKVITSTDSIVGKTLNLINALMGVGKFF